MRRIEEFQADNFLKKRKVHKYIRRAVALLSAFVMLFTVNTLKRNANTLERIPTCGYEEHVHDGSCFNEAGELICGMEEHIHTEQVTPSLDIDCALRFDEINNDFMRQMRYFNPFGPENVRPVFVTRNVHDCGTTRLVGRNQEHIKLELVDSNSNTVMNGIAFGQSASARYIKSRRSFDIVYTLEENIYKRGNVQLQIEDIKPNED